MRVRRIVALGVLTTPLSLGFAGSVASTAPAAPVALPAEPPQGAPLPGLVCIQNALGGVRAVAGVSALRITADTKPAATGGPGPLPGTRDMNLVFPDRYRRIEIGQTRTGGVLRSVVGFDRDELLSSPRGERGHTMRIARQEFVAQTMMRVPRTLPGVRLSERVAQDGGQERLVIEAVSPDDLRTTLMADRTTCVPVAVQYQFPPGSSLRTVRTELSDYRVFDGLRFATKVDTTRNGVPFTVERVSRVEVNPPGAQQSFATSR